MDDQKAAVLLVLNRWIGVVSITIQNAKCVELLRPIYTPGARVDYRTGNTTGAASQPTSA